MANEDLEKSSRHHGPSSEQNKPPYVLISYAHADEAHDEAVRHLAHLLRLNGVEAELDLYAARHRQDWAAWHQQHITRANFVLIIASSEYKKQAEGDETTSQGRSVYWESLLIRDEIYRDRQVALRKYLPIILPGHSAEELPAWLNPRTATSYSVEEMSEEGIVNLLRVITNQPEEQETAIGATPLLLHAPSVEPHQERSDTLQIPTVTTEDSHLLAPLPGIFLHYFDPHFLSEVSVGRNVERVNVEARRATQLAILAAQAVYVPAASYLESDLCTQIVNNYQSLFELGQVVLVGSEANLIDFATLKMLQYEEGGQRHAKYRAALGRQDETPPFRTRQRSATTDIRKAWWRGLTDLGRFTEGIAPSQVSDLEERWADVPGALAGRAFTPEYAVLALYDSTRISDVQNIIAKRAGSYINRHYTQSYVDELQVGVVTDLNYLHSPHVPSAGVNLPFKAAVRALTEAGCAERVFNASPIELVNLRADNSITRAFVSAFQKSIHTSSD
ncbi:SEFIR domain-containing protein [Amycolatopsis sp. NPDC026612]|uniref:SEFIR domain-containing protein n=1 Tax=Amycolatopsis sp. NPDC026612 TaxID=3155466 RepID=UPI0033E2EC13